MPVVIAVGKALLDSESVTDYYIKKCKETLMSENIINKNSDVKSAIKNLVDLSQNLSKDISAVRPADNQAHFDGLKSRAGAVRGRPLFYDYVGTGVGHGPYVKLEDGSVKQDLINGIGIHIFGHNHPLIIEHSLKGALSDVVMQGNLEPNNEYIEVCESLLDAAKGSRFKHVWLATCGSMSNENALKICRQKTNGARKILAMKSAFAGRSTMMAEVTDNPSLKEGLPEYNEVLRVPFFDKNNPNSINESTEIMKKFIEDNKGDICAFMFEPMQGEGGYNVAPREFFLPLFEMCKQHKIPIWADEVQTFCRTSEFFAFQTLDFADYVDICTVAKALQNGAALYTEEMNPRPGLIAGTFSGSSVSLTVGKAILEELKTGSYLGPKGKIMGIHNEFVGMLNELNETTCKGLLNDAGGLGLMVAVTPLDGTKEKQIPLLKTLFKNGIIAFGCGKGPFRLRFLLPAILNSQHIAEAKKIIEKSILEHT